MEQTPNYKLTKPGYEDFGDVDALNGNMDKLDAALKANADALSAQAAAAVKGAQALAAHLADENNPHGVTAPQIGAIAAATLGQPGGPAQLGADGRLPAEQLGDVGGGGSLLTLRFDAAFLGCTWTLTGGGETYTGTVDSGLTATVSVKGVGTTYTLAAECNGVRTAVSFVTPEYFTAMTVKLEPMNVFGVCWDTSNSSTALTRLTPETDPYGYVTQSVTAEPSPAVGTGAGSSPFDNFMPWSGMKECNLNQQDGSIRAWQGDYNFGRGEACTMVYIPEFYVAAHRDGSKQYFYISDKPRSGMTKHPGSGKYVGKYHATNMNAMSFTGAKPQTDATRAQFRSGIKNLHSKFHLYDFATYCAIIFLYIVEFADWNCQSKIGRGYVDNNSSAIASGGTDSMVYHTGRAAGTDGKTAVQYRWIENLWGNVNQWVDGFNANGTTAYCCTDPSKYADDTATGYTAIGTLPASGWIKDLTVTDNGLLIPKTSGGSETTYITDPASSSSGGHVLYVGGYWYSGSLAGLLCFNAYNVSSHSYSGISARLLCEA